MEELELLDKPDVVLEEVDAVVVAIVGDVVFAESFIGDSATEADSPDEVAFRTL